jgi:hypothetical protein
MIHEFTIKSGNTSIGIHVVARTREDAVELLKDSLFDKKIKLEINENCMISVTIKDVDEEITMNEIVIPLQQEPSERKKEDGRYFAIRESFIERLAPSPEDLSSGLPDDDDEEVTRPDNPVAIRHSSHKMKAVK